LDTPESPPGLAFDPELDEHAAAPEKTHARKPIEEPANADERFMG
jgi:hypothetical protein